ncbi:uncharacterized protein PITG_02383 [Phytophthora infestans T30-4]|uniref:MYND-type domain-containing protein n=1 Tax=Phytophthora infestans (strain T30-4) TaxID=403677 RepID=D0MW71_PHYIT|nr:uncharacterized protein PITG_02383 [Phytophthora infestans T30-4]EEY63884.1 conserved hypothetical protein [Phytophthora infestans T30-4]|eukprot:XP_002907320.1 conserved hypothetical protein [Phytophthora infestans T30-4]
MDVNVQAGGDGPVGVVPCENCGKPSHKRCSRCKAFAVCDKACMAAIWRRHKPDCNNVVATQKHLDVYTKYGVEEPPGRKSKMNVDKKSAFFLDFLKVHDSSSPENKNAPLPEKLFLNRRYNNAYSHAMKTLTFLELDRLNALMQKHHIGTANRMCQ